MTVGRVLLERGGRLLSVRVATLVAIAIVALLGTGAAPGVAGSSALGVVSRVPVPEGVRASAVALHGSVAYLGRDDGRVEAVSLADPAVPRLLAALELERPIMRMRTAAAAELLLVCHGGAGVTLVDLRHPAAPRKLWRVDTPGFARGAAVHRDHLFVADGMRLEVYALNGSEPPSQAGSMTGLLGAWDVAVEDETAFVADDHDFLKIVDVADPARPTLVGHLPARDWALGIAVRDGFAYVAGRILHVIDVRDARAPEVVGSVIQGPKPWAVALSRDHALLAGGTSDLPVVDVTEPTSPALVRWMPLPGQPVEIDATDELVAVAGNAGGFIVLTWGGPAAPATPGPPDGVDAVFLPRLQGVSSSG